MGTESITLGSGAGDFPVGLSSVDPVAECVSVWGQRKFGNKKKVVNLNPSSGSPSNTACLSPVAGWQSWLAV